jgi:flagellar operon protein
MTTPRVDSGAPSSAHLKNLVQAHRAGGADFSQLLRQKVEQKPLSFSAHAETRIKSRNIEITAETMAQLNKAVQQAESKGCRDSLILMRDKAFIVNIPNKTVITAMDGESIRENVFTNIDSTVIAG